MIKAVIFDCFGVLATDGWLPFKRKHFGHDTALLQEATDLNKQSDAGILPYEDYVVQIAALAEITPEEVIKNIEHNVPDDELFGYIRELKKDYKIGLLSNAAGNWLEHIFTEEQRSVFDAVALSFETGFIKPRPEAYQIIAERLGVKPGECILVDDQPGYASGAEAAGMPFVLYKDPTQLHKELGALLANAK